eukprot:s2362_g5.t1
MIPWNGGEGQQASQIPRLINLLNMGGMPGMEDLSQDLQVGFQVLGELNAGAGWLPPADQKYSFPVAETAFKKNKRHYAIAKLQSKRVGLEWATMQAEPQSELQKGRMSGPYLAPQWWPTEALSIDDRPLMQLDDRDICRSFCFSVKQADKVRRCEDFRRSGHNSTVIAHDAAASSVWNFNRAADAITFLYRRLLATSVGHYVDDFIGIENHEIVHGGFESFAQLSRILGLRIKESKALAPDANQKVLGIDVTINEDGVVLAPHPKRCQKVLQTIAEVLSSNSLFGDEAQRLEGNLIFLTSTLFGQLGRLYARAHGHQRQDKSDQLSWPLRSALRTLQGLLREVHPRFAPRSLDQPAIVIYTDAYFVLHGRRTAISGLTGLPKQWSKSRCAGYENGWGYVIHFEGTTYYAAGRVPKWLLKKFCTRKAFIYFLEVLAQLIAFLSCLRFPSALRISFIDNTSGNFALRKGYCKDECICNMIALTWHLIASGEWHVHLEWAASALNISDQVSRHNLEDMRQLQATQDHPADEELFKILYWVAGDSEYAHGPELEDFLAISSQLPSAFRTGCVGGLAPVRHEKGRQIQPAAEDWTQAMRNAQPAVEKAQQRSQETLRRFDQKSTNMRKKQ